MEIKRVLLGITSLTIGGAERVLVDISNALCKKYDITIFSIYDNGELKKDLKKNVKYKSLYNCRYDELTAIRKIWIPIKLLLFNKLIYNKKIKQDYDVEVAFLEGPITRLFSTKNKDARKLVWIHNDIEKVFGNGLKARLKGKIDRKVYGKYEKIVFVSEDNMKKFQRKYRNINPNNMQVIYNYINSELVKKKSEEFSTELLECRNKKFVSVCRLVNQKAIDRLIRVHSRLIKYGYDHSFFIIGDGPEKEKLENLIKKEEVCKTFFLLGRKENPYPYIKEADYFCLLSYFEGYGMVLEEAKILNKNIIITNTAARESMKDYGKWTILDNDEEAIYRGLLNILQNKVECAYQSEYMYSNKDRLESIMRLLG